MLPCLCYVDPPATGAWNMGVDEHLLEQAADEGVAALRFYQWNEPTLSLGYFQNYAERQQHVASRGAAVVRRLSGGGALVHDRELTYSLALPAGHELARRPQQLYAEVHAALIEALAARGVPARLQADAADLSTTEPAAAEPFLCFARRTDADLVLRSPTAEAGSVKIVGSAQRRRRGAVLQHGAVLLDASSTAPELPGLAQAAGVTLEPRELIEPLSSLIAARLSLQLVSAPSLTASSCQRCNDRAAKHGSRGWIERR
jgi:lipoate-protein ligase A